jgi:hypothetical protein
MADVTPNQAKLDYIAGPGFKKDIWAGGSAEEKSARASFIGELLNHGVQVGDTKAVTNLGLFLRWNASGLDNVYRAVLAGNTKLDAVTKALTGALAAVSGGQAFDEAKLLQSIEDRVAAGMAAGLASVTADVTLTVKPGADTKGGA